MSATTSLREAARRAGQALGIGSSFDRRALRERLAALEGPHAEAARIRAEETAVAKAELEAWREPLLRAQRLEATHRAATYAEAHERDRLEFELRRHPASCVVALQNFRDALYGRINARRAGDEEVVPPERMAALGAALCAATAFVRDDAWRLTDAEAQRRCLELRAAIDAALEAPEPEDAA